MYSTIKSRLSISFLLTFELFLSSCQTAQKPSEMTESLEYYKPIVSKNGSNILLDKDRQECLEIVKISKIKSDKSSINTFRGCLIDKGYLLLS